jgi:hypothetical protein
MSFRKSFAELHEWDIIFRNCVEDIIIYCISRDIKLNAYELSNRAGGFKSLKDRINVLSKKFVLLLVNWRSFILSTGVHDLHQCHHIDTEREQMKQEFLGLLFIEIDHYYLRRVSRVEKLWLTIEHYCMECVFSKVDMSDSNYINLTKETPLPCLEPCWTNI